MRVAFYDVGAGSLGIQYLAGALQAWGHEPKIFFDRSFSKNHIAQDFFLTPLLSLSDDQVCDGIAALNPEAVCFSLYSYNYKEHIGLVRRFRERYPQYPVICGGVHTSLLPEVVLNNPEVDFVVLGEAEQSLPTLLDAIGEKGVGGAKELPAEALPGVWNRRNGDVVKRGLSPIARNLDELPFPDMSLHYDQSPGLDAIYATIASRGCFCACTYCNSPSLTRLYKDYNERYYRARSVDNLLEELHQAVEKHKPKYVEFFDDAFGANRKWLTEFSERYKKEIGLPYDIQTNPTIQDEESLRLLADSGCVNMEFGLQSANERLRADVLNRHEKNDKVQALIQQAHDLGIFVELDLIVNLPKEQWEHVEESVAFVRETRPELVNVGFLQYFPKTPIADLAVAEGLIEPEDLKRAEEGEGMSSLRLMSKAKLNQNYRLLPFEIFLVSRFPAGLANAMIRFIRLPLMRSICSFAASYLLYFVRTYICMTDRRDFFLRHEMFHAFRGIRPVLAQKFATWRRGAPPDNRSLPPSQSSRGAPSAEGS